MPTRANKESHWVAFLQRIAANDPAHLKIGQDNPDEFSTILKAGHEIFAGTRYGRRTSALYSCALPWAREHRGRRLVGILRGLLDRHERDPAPAIPRSAFGYRSPARVTTSAAATVTAMTVTTEGHTPTRLASGCEPPIAATYTAPCPAAGGRPPCPVPLPGAPSACRGEQRPAELTAAERVRRATKNPPTSPSAATPTAQK